MKIAIVGAGAAGCFCAVNIKKKMPESEVVVFEAGKRPLAKVSVTGGGRCNLTNSFAGIRNLVEAYPRGDKLMKRAMNVFDQNSTIDWFSKEGVRLVVQSDNCVFPASQDAMQIVNTLLLLMRRLGVVLCLNHNITDISILIEKYDRVVVTTGGSPKHTGLSFLDALELNIVEPVPSLFSFNIKDEITQLMGAVVENVSVKIAGTKFKTSGALLITHWGMSGPAILKLSSYAARYLSENGYRATLSVNWLGEDHTEESAMQLIQGLVGRNGQKQISSVHPDSLTSRIWLYIINKCKISADRRLCELGKKQLHVLAATLVNDQYGIEGKCRFKDEFVTCGGVALDNINLNTLESKKYPGLYFAGEVLDIDAITGGFNLQAAWSCGYVVAESICKEKIKE